MPEGGTVRKSDKDSPKLTLGTLDYADIDLQLLVAGAPLPDARLAERRAFDWHSLSRFFNAAPEELHAMSERALFYRQGDDSRRGLFRQRAPWMQEPGYASHCPHCLRQAQYWKKSWIGPDALVCPHHNTIMVRHCHGCGGDLSRMTWANASPICPVCGAHLSLSPVITAPPKIAERAAAIRERFDGLASRRPVVLWDYDLAHFAAVWRAARLLRSETTGFKPLNEAMLSLAGIVPHAEEIDVESLAFRDAQALVVADLIGELEPRFSEHYWLSATNAATLLGADRIVNFKLAEIAHALGIALPSKPPAWGQATMSLASWQGANGMPKAA